MFVRPFHKLRIWNFRASTQSDSRSLWGGRGPTRPQVLSYGAAIGACTRASRWELAPAALAAKMHVHIMRGAFCYPIHLTACVVCKVSVFRILRYFEIP